MSGHRDSQARIEIRDAWEHGRASDSCNMCWHDAVVPEVADGVKLIAFFSPIGQSLITLALCRQHRQQLRDAIEKAEP